MSADNKKVVSNENLAAFAEALAAKVPLKSDIPTKVSDLQNDLGFTDKQGTITSVTLNGTTTSSGGVDLGYLVVQEGGKGLSSNDYTALEKNKLGGIDTGAQVNTIETVKVNGTALVPDANKAVNVQVPTTVAELSDASDYAKTSDLEDYVLITDLEDTEEVLAAAVNDLNNRLDGLVDQYPTENSTNAVSSGGVYEAITENELVTAASLSDLNARVSDLESIGTPEETDPVFSASPAAGITAANITSWNSKVDASEYEEDSEVVASALNDLNTRISDVSNGVASITDSIPDILIIDWYFRPGSYYTGDQYVWEDIENALQEGKYVIIKNSYEYNDNISPLYYHFVEAFEDSEGGRFWCFATPCCYNGRYYKVVLNSGDGFESFESRSLQGVRFNNVWSSIHDGTVSISESDPVFSASAAAGITASDITNWNSKTSNTGTLTGISFNGTAATVTNGVASITASIPDVANYFDEVAYDSQTKRINFKHGNTVKKYIDATDFIKDGMVDSVEIATPESGDNAGVSCLVVTFNTDAGKEDIEIPLSSIFNPSNYYTKTEIESRDIWEPGTGTGSAVLKGTGNIASGNYSVAEGCEDIYKVGFTVRALTDSEKSRISSRYGKDGALYSGFLESTWDPDTGTTSYTIYSDPACIQQAAVFSGTNIFFSDDNVEKDDGGSFCGYIFNIPDSGSLTPGNTYYHVYRREGYPTRATGLASHAEGLTTTASGDASHAEGQHTYAIGDYSHAEGDGPSAYGRSSHAEGITTHANGGHSHAEGYGSTAGNSGSHAEGLLTSAMGEYSHTEGWHTNTQNLGEHAEGKYNRSVQNKTIHSTGIGDGDEHPEMNAFEIWNDGKIFLYNVYGYDGTNPSANTSIQEFLDITPFSSSEYDSLFVGDPDFNYIYFDDYPGEEGITEYAHDAGFDGDQNFINAIVDSIDEGNPLYEINCYKYTGEVFEYNNTPYWLFQIYDPVEEDWINNSSIQYMLVETNKTLAGLTAQSLEGSMNNRTIPYYALLSLDNTVYRLGEDSDDILIAVR